MYGAWQRRKDIPGSYAINYGKISKSNGEMNFLNKNSDLEDRMVEFTAVEQNKEKRMKRNEDKPKRPLGQH